MIVKQNALTPELFLELYTSVGWEPPCIGQVRTALEHSVATFVAYDDHLPVGMVRLIGDGGMSFYRIRSSNCLATSTCLLGYRWL